MQLVGRRTYAVCIVIIVLALVQKFLAVPIPNEIWLGLFGLAVLFLRASQELPAAASLILLLLIPTALFTGCSTVSDKQAAAIAKTADHYYVQPKVATILEIANTNTNQTCEITVKNFTHLVLSTPVPPLSILPKDAGVVASIVDGAKAIAPYVLFGWLFHGGVQGNSTSTVNNAAPATP